MRTGIAITLSDRDRRHLAALVDDRNAAQKHVWRAAIVLLSADGLGTADIMRRTGKSKTCVWRWQERFATEGIDGLLRDKTRRSRIPPLSRAAVARVLALTRRDPPSAATHWTAAALAKQAGVSLSSVQRIWKAHELQPHRARRFPVSSSPTFVSRLRDIIGLYVDPHLHALMLSADDRAPGLALNRSSSHPPVKRGPLGSKEKRDEGGLLAALDFVETAIAGHGIQRRSRRAFSRLLDAVADRLPTGKYAHVVVAGNVDPMDPWVQAWLHRHPRFTFHHVSPSCPWRAAVERCIDAPSPQGSRRFRFRSAPDLNATIERLMRDAPRPQPYIAWNADAPATVSTAAAKRHQVSESTRHDAHRRKTSPKGPDLAHMIGYRISLLTPLGFLSIFAEGDTLVALDFGHAPEGDRSPLLAEAKRQLDAYFDGRLRDFDLPCAPAGTPFQQAVWLTLRHIPYGTTATYGDVAARTGGSAREVGGACGRNPIPIVIPCHRVVGAGHRLVGYSGGEGPETKQALLCLEGAMLL